MPYPRIYRKHKFKKGRQSHMVNLGGVEKVGNNDQNTMYKILIEQIKVLSKQRKYSQNWVQHVKDIKCFIIFMCRAHFCWKWTTPYFMHTNTHTHPTYPKLPGR